MNRPLFLGHRGARIYAPENTFAAFDAALDDGCDGFEFDVRLSRDSVPVICHDPESAGNAIAENDAATLQLPTLASVIENYASRAFLNIELKVAGAESETVSLLQEHRADRVVVSSFLPQAVTAMASARGGLHVPLGYICCDPELLPPWKQLPISHVMLHFTLMNDELVNEVLASGKKIFVWTVNDPAHIERFSQMGVAGIISDDSKLSRLLKR